MPIIILLLKLIGILGGLFFAYVAALVYEDGEKRIQSVLETLWLRVHYLQEQALSAHTAFMRVVAGVLTKIFDRIFGDKLFSLRSVAVSLCYAVAAFAFTFFLFSWAYEGDAEAMRDFFTAFLYGAVLGTIPVFLRKSKWVKVWLALLFLYVAYDIIGPFLLMSVVILSLIKDAGLALFPWIIMGGLVFSFGFFILFVGITRYLARRVAQSESFLRMALFTALNCTPLLLLLITWVLFLFYLGHAGPVTSGGNASIDWNTGTAMVLFIGVFCALMTNFVFLCSTALFMLLAAAMLAHRVTWPLLARPTYALQRLGIAKRKKLCGSLSGGLLFLSIGKFELLVKILDLLNPF
jgi:hypothetical protein